MSSSYNFKDNLTIDNNKYLKWLDITGTSRANIISLDNLNNVKINSAFGDLVLNSESGNSYTFLNVNGNNSGVIIGSKMGIGFNTTTNMNSILTLNKNNFIGINTTTGSNDGYLGLAGSSSLNSTGSRIILYGNETDGKLNLYAGNTANGTINLFTGDDKMRLQILNDGTLNVLPDGINSRLIVNDTSSTFTNNVILSSGTESTNATTGALTVSGGMGITGNVYVEGSLTLTTMSTGNLNFSSSNVSTSYSSGAVVLTGGMGISNTTNSSSVTAGGALSIAGGAAIGKDLYVGGKFIILDSTSATSSENASVVLYGGLGVNNNILLRSNNSSQIKLSPTTDGSETSISFYSKNNFISTSNTGSSWTLGHNVNSVSSGNFALVNSQFGNVLSAEYNGKVSILGNVYINSQTLKVPVGTTAERPTPAEQGFIRYNSQLGQFEGFGAGNVWGSLGSGEGGGGGSITTSGNIIANSINLGVSNMFSGSFTPSNNVAVATDVTGLYFNNSDIRSFIVNLSVSITRTTGGNLYEHFILEGNQTDTTWELSFSSMGDITGFVFTITSLGQIQYTSTNITNYSNSIIRYNVNEITNTGTYDRSTLETQGTLITNTIQILNTQDVNVTVNNGALYVAGGVTIDKTLNVVGNIITNSINLGVSNMFSGAFTPSNNVAVATDVTGLYFNNSDTRSFIVNLTASITRTTGGNLYEYFTLEGHQSDASWELLVSSIGDSSGFVFTITSLGQIQYTSTNITNYSNSILRYNVNQITNTGTYNRSGLETQGTLITNTIQILNTQDVDVGINNGSLYVAGGVTVDKTLLTSTLKLLSTEIALGHSAGTISQGVYSVAIGSNSGVTSQGNSAVAIGEYAGYDSQGFQTVAIGFNSGAISQGNMAVAIGNIAAIYNQGGSSVAVGDGAGTYYQGGSSVAIGVYAGNTSQGNYAIAIGKDAGATSQHSNSIILNASGTDLNSATAGTFYVSPVRNMIQANLLAYDTSSKEVTYFSLSNITTTNLVTTNLSAGSLAFSNINLNTATIGTSLLAIGNSNTIGSIITTGGNVGIGMSNPFSRVNILSTNNLASNTETGQNGLAIQSGTTNNVDMILYMGADKTNKISYIQSVLWGVTTNPLILNPRGGNVGIGTTSPSDTLDVSGTARITTSLTTGTINSTNITSTNIVGTNVSSSNAQITNENVTTSTIGTARVTTSLLAIGNSNTIGSIFTTGGNVGIGTTSPASSLHVAGLLSSNVGSGISMGIGGDGNSGIQVNSGSNGSSNVSYIDFGYSGIDFVSRIIHTNNNRSLQFQVNASATPLILNSTGTVSVPNGIIIATNNPANFSHQTITANVNFPMIFCANRGNIASFGFANGDASVGYVNINTSSYTLDVSGTGRFTGTLSLTGSATGTGIDLATNDRYAEMRVIRNSTFSSDKDMYLQFGAGAGSKLFLYSNNTQTMALNSGSVNISGPSGSGSNGSLLITGRDAFGHSLYIDSYTNSRRLALNNDGTVGNIFAYNFAGSAAQNLNLQGPGGNVGIGTGTPSSKLHVVGNIRADSIEMNSGGGAKQFASGTQAGGSATGSTNFPFTFTSVPVVVANIVQNDGASVFGVQITSVSTTGFSYRKTFYRFANGYGGDAVSESFYWIAMT